MLISKREAGKPMADFASSYVGRLRKLVGNRLLLVPGARIVVEGPSGQILLQKRSDFDVWGLPGGNAEEGESLDTAIVRETAEETGLEILDFKPFGFGCDPTIETFTFANGDRCQTSCSTSLPARSWGLQRSPTRKARPSIGSLPHNCQACSQTCAEVLRRTSVSCERASFK